MKVSGYAALDAKSPLRPYDFDRREVRPNDVLIEILFSGICHSDIHMARDEWGGSVFPMVPGHEIVGRVKEVGPAVKKFKAGDIAGVGCMVDACLTCGTCHEGLEQYCENGFVGTYGATEKDGKSRTMGGYSTFIVVREEFVLKVPANLDLSRTAPLLCAGITTFSPLKKLGVGKGHKVGVLGLGGLGHMAVKIAASFGAEVTVLSGSAEKAEDAKKLGAHKFALTSDEKQIAAMSESLDFIIDTVAAKHNVTQALGLLKREGTLVMVGAADKPLDLGVFSLIMKRRKIMGSLIGGIAETQEMLDHCGKHNIMSDIEMIKASQINDAYERMIKGDVRYRFVIDAKSFGM